MIKQRMKAVISALRFGLKHDHDMEKVNIFVTHGFNKTMILISANGQKVCLGSFSSDQEAVDFLSDGRRSRRGIHSAINKMLNVQPITITSTIDKTGDHHLLVSVLKDGSQVFTGVCEDKATARKQIREQVKALRKAHKEEGTGADFTVDKTIDNAKGFRKASGKGKSKEQASSGQGDTVNVKFTLSIDNTAFFKYVVTRMVSNQPSSTASYDSHAQAMSAIQGMADTLGDLFNRYGKKVIIEIIDLTGEGASKTYTHESEKVSREEAKERRYSGSDWWHIRPNERKSDYFKRIIGAEGVTSPTDIKRCYKSWMNKNHPDKCGEANHKLVATINHLYCEYYR